MDLTKLTPAQRQYMEIKNEYKDCILFFRMGDFYETFYEDAKLCSKVLDIALTSRDKKSENPVAMAGVPYHSADKYIAKLVKSGYKVAIAEQVGEVKPGQIVKRQVTSIVTPGTFMDYKDIKNYNYILSVYFDDKYNICWGDFSVGEYWTKSFGEFENLIKFIQKINPSEIVIDINFPQKEELQYYINNFSKVLFSIYDLPANPEFLLKNILEVQTLASYGKALEDGRISCTSLLFNYLKETQKTAIKNITNICFWGDEDKILFDEISIKNLEIFQSSYESNVKYSLLGVIDNTFTPMGGRLLRHVLASPSGSLDEIIQRQSNIKYYYENENISRNLIESLKNIGDIPRLITSIIYKKNTPLFWNRLISILSNIYNDVESAKRTQDELVRIGTSPRIITLIQDFYNLLNKALKLENFGEDMDFIADGYNKEIDEYRKIAYHSDELLIQYQQDVVKQTGLNNIKIKFITNQGYFIEVSKKDAGTFESKSVRDDEKFDYLRRQTLKIAERYTTPYLDQIQGKIIGAKEVLSRLEKQILEEFKQQLESYSKEFAIFNNNLAWLDLFVSIAQIALQKNRCFPLMSNKYELNILGGRHPVIEQYLLLGDSFVPNDLDMGEVDYIHTITGPNMGGKSTFLRQNAIIVLMAHCGFPVPAKQATIGLVDGIFARVGSGDVIAKNQSTFMTEMIEVSNILHNSTKNSFIVLDELGRGTSTYDGLALARAIMVFIAQNIKAKTLFATHYHELISLEGQIDGIVNYSVGVYETDKQVVFLKKIVKGGANKSYGIDVAKLAGIPKNILEAAKDYLNQIEGKKIDIKFEDKGLFESKNFDGVYKDKYDNIKNFVETIDPNNITPLQALELLNKLKGKL